jgi:Cys-tRNA(Pro) deacylase
MAKDKIPSTRAVRALKQAGFVFSLHFYKYQEHGGTEVAANALGVDEHIIIKTLVFEDDKQEPLLLLMHGDRTVSTKSLSRALGVKTIRPCDPKVVHRHTGYVVGGISPFGTKKRLRTYIERSILDLPKIYINAGKRGLLAEVSPKDLARTLGATPVDVAK